VTPDVTFDFSGMTSTFHELRQRGSLLDPRALWTSITQGRSLLPQVVENMLDAKAELDVALRTVISDLVTASAERITAPLAGQAGPVAAGTKQSVTSRGFDAAAAVKAACGLAEKEVPHLRKKLEGYIDDARTRETLVYAVQQQVLQNYDAFYERWSAERRSLGKAVSSKGKGREGEVWDGETFQEWVADVFGVRLAVLEDGGGQNGRRLSGGSLDAVEDGDGGSDVGSV